MSALAHPIPPPPPATFPPTSPRTPHLREGRLGSRVEKEGGVCSSHLHDRETEAEKSLPAQHTVQETQLPFKGSFYLAPEFQERPPQSLFRWGGSLGILPTGVHCRGCDIR